VVDALSRSKQIGTRFEREVCQFLVASGFPNADRGVLRGNKDRGDVIGLPNWTLELKATKEISLSSAVDEARVEAINAKTLWYAAVIKRRRRGIGESYVVLPLALFTKLIK
jgi:Holliday junction resolvase